MKPIIFSTEMTKAILEGRKTQTRRVLNWKENYEYGNGTYSVSDKYGDWLDITETTFNRYGQKGDILYVRETFAKYNNKEEYLYKADINININFKRLWKPSIFMPKAAARLFLKITNVRVEKLQDISGDDAIREGIIDGGCLNCGNNEPCGCKNPEPDKIDAFVYLWDSINKKRGYGWFTNPYVWVIEFERTEYGNN